MSFEIVSLQIMYSPDPKISAIPMKVVLSGNSPNTITPQKIAIGSAMYSKGATTAASLIL